MARPRSHHQDRPLSGAERARLFRERKRLRNEIPERNEIPRHPHRNEIPERNETRVTKPRNETPSVSRINNNARKVHALMKELGYPPDDITLARKIIGEHFPAKSKEAIAIAYKRALSDLLKIDRWVSLVRKWGGHRYDARPQAARDE